MMFSKKGDLTKHLKLHQDKDVNISHPADMRRKENRKLVTNINGGIATNINGNPDKRLNINKDQEKDDKKEKLEDLISIIMYITCNNI